MFLNINNIIKNLDIEAFKALTELEKKDIYNSMPAITCLHYLSKEECEYNNKKIIKLIDLYYDNNLRHTFLYSNKKMNCLAFLISDSFVSKEVIEHISHKYSQHINNKNVNNVLFTSLLFDVSKVKNEKQLSDKLERCLIAFDMGYKVSNKSVQCYESIANCLLKLPFYNNHIKLLREKIVEKLHNNKFHLLVNNLDAKQNYMNIFLKDLDIFQQEMSTIKKMNKRELNIGILTNFTYQLRRTPLEQKSKFIDIFISTLPEKEIEKSLSTTLSLLLSNIYKSVVEEDDNNHAKTLYFAYKSFYNHHKIDSYLQILDSLKTKNKEFLMDTYQGLYALEEKHKLLDSLNDVKNAPFTQSIRRL